MKTSLKKIAVLFAVYLLISGCKNPFDPLQEENSPVEKGSFSLVVDGVRAGRTIMPEIQESAFVAYTLTFFVGTINNSSVVVNRTPADLEDEVVLDTGIWDLLVTAYLDTERTKPAAQGSISGIEITTGEETTGSVTLSQITTTGSGQGTFSWEIEYPAEVNKASMTITRLSGNNETVVDTWFFQGGTNPEKDVDDEDTLSLDVGYYRVVFTLTDTAGKSVVWREILHVYDSKDSAFSHEFTSNQFVYTLITVTFDSQGGSTVPSQSVNVNSPVARPVNPTRSGYNFVGWYTTSGLTTLYDFSTPVTGNITLYARWNTADAEGIYVGIIKFADQATDITTTSSTNTKPILLNDSNRSALISRLTSSYSIATSPGTTMFYAVHKALANLTTNEFSFPTNTDSVSVITFTDGLDLSSAGLSRQSAYRIEGKEFQSNADYAEYVRNEIENRTIAGLNVTAYSVGVRGDDVTDIPAFQNNLARIASPGKSQELTDFTEVQATFDSIAQGLTITSTSMNFTMVTTLFDNGTKVRMTFDVDDTNLASMAASQRYIEGTITLAGSTYTFTDIIYGGGISSDAGTGPLIGTTVGTQVGFVFNNITILDTDKGETTNYSPPEDTTRQWISPESTWSHNSEYSAAGSSISTYEKSSAIVYLVLDCSTSLSTTQISQIKEAAINFINSVYAQYNNVQSSGSRQITVEMWDSYGDGWNGAALRINVNGTYLSSNAQLNGSGPTYYTFNADPGNTVTLSWLSGSYDSECAYAVYYSDAPPNPGFSPSSGTSDSTRLLLYKRYNSSAVGNSSFTVQ